MPNFSPATTVTITLASLANGASVLSSAIDNTVTRYSGALIQLKVKTGATINTKPSLTVSVLGSIDGVTYSTFLVPENILAKIPNLASSSTYIYDFALLDNLPPFWKFVVTNNTGGALDATGGNHAVTFVGVKDEDGVETAAAANLHAPTSNTAAVVTYTAVPGHMHQIDGVVVSYVGGTVAGGNLKIEDGVTTVFSVDIKTEGIYIIPIKLQGTANTNLVVTLAAGGSGVSGKLNVYGKGLN